EPPTRRAGATARSDAHFDFELGESPLVSTTHVRLICHSPQGTDRPQGTGRGADALISSRLACAASRGVSSKKRRKPAKDDDDDRRLVWAAIEQADIDAQCNQATGEHWLCQKWVGLRVFFEADPRGGSDDEVRGEITGFEWQGAHSTPGYAAVITTDDDDEPEYSFLDGLPEGVIAAEDDQPDNVLLEYDDDDVEPGVEEALELHYGTDSDDEAAAEQEANEERAPTDPTDTTEPTEPSTSFDQPATQHLRRSTRKRS
ncbi:MAG: hypothetical protein AAGK09_12035, partial [Planctomycetota bacterium]